MTLHTRLHIGAPKSVTLATQADPVLWITRGLETLWLIAVVSVPLVYLGREYGEWSSIIGSYELPKIALLRVVTGLMAILWVLEWALTGPSPSGIWSSPSGWLFRPGAWLNQLYGWLIIRPVRWLWLAVGLYAFSVFLSTVLSGALSVSLWGDVPGQDSYSAYTVTSYIVLFGVVATHLKTPSQLWRLLSAILFMGALVGGYAILQHYRYDFLNLLEPVGSNRASSATGGAIFAASLLVMTVPASLLTATSAIRGALNAPKTWGIIGIFALLIAVQILGALFTLSRGSWVGTGFALTALLILTAAFVGWRYAAKAALALAVAVIVTTVVLVTPIPKLGEAEIEKGSSVAAVGERLTSITSQVTTGSVSGRRAIWENSWDLMIDRPWAGFDNLDLEFLRSVIGYGPDLYRYTYLLVSPESPGGRAPNEVAHGHNIVVHQGVELGFLGIIGTLAVFLAPLLLAAYWLLRRGKDLHNLHKLVLAGLVAVLAGRFLEQLVGVGRVSDHALAWTILAIFAALPAINWSSPSGEALNRSGMERIPAKDLKDVRALWSLSWISRPRVLSSILLVALVAAGVGSLIWFKNVNYVRAAIVADQGAEKFRSGDLTGALGSLDSAINIAPDVSAYYQQRNSLSSIYRQDVSASSPTMTTAISAELERLVKEDYARNARWVDERPFNVRSRLSWAESALALEALKPDSGWGEEAASLLEETVQLLPANLTLRNLLAEVYISLGQADAALPHLAVAKTAGEPHGDVFLALVHEATAYRQLGEFEKSLQSWDEAVARRPMNPAPYYERGATHYAAGDLVAAISDLDESIKILPDQARAYHLRGTAYYNLGRFNHAVSDLDQAISLSPGLAPAYNNRGLAYAQLGRLETALRDFDSAIGLDSSLSVAYNNRGFTLRDLVRLEEALQDLTRAVNLDSEFQMAYFNRALANTILGRQADAVADAQRAIELGFDPDLLSQAIDELRTLE